MSQRELFGERVDLGRAVVASPEAFVRAFVRAFGGVSKDGVLGAQTLEAGLAPCGGCSKVQASTPRASARRSMFPSAMFQVDRSTAET
jgi:hypothetical protein